MPSLLPLGKVEALYFFRGEWLKQLPTSFISEKDRDLKTIIIFHGYGANAWDLSSLAAYHGRYIDTEQVQDYLWIFPQGLLNLAGNTNDFGQRAWFPISVERLLLQKTASPDFLSQQTIHGSENLQKTLMGFVALLADRGIRQIILGGFSQGGMLAYHLLPSFKALVSVDTLAIFSTVSIDFNRYHQLWHEQIPYQSLKTLLQSHGTRDEVLDHNEGKKLFAYLSPYFQRAEFIEFIGGHTITDDTLLTFFKFL